MEMINENFEPQINSSLSSISNESLEIDFCSISIPLELNEFDNSFKASSSSFVVTDCNSEESCNEAKDLVRNYIFSNVKRKFD